MLNVSRESARRFRTERANVYRPSLGFFLMPAVYNTLTAQLAAVVDDATYDVLLGTAKGCGDGGF